MKSFLLEEIFSLKEISAVKVASILSMCDDNIDEELTNFFKKRGIYCVITRAGGRGANLKDKLFRNTLTAAENSGVTSSDKKYKHIFFVIFDKLFSKIGFSMFEITGGGFKIGICRHKNFIAVAISGKMGIPGIEADYNLFECVSEYIED